MNEESVSNVMAYFNEVKEKKRKGAIYQTNEFGKISRTGTSYKCIWNGAITISI
jgi:hypothetical protein